MNDLLGSQHFAALDVNLDNEKIYAEQYTSIVVAYEAYSALNNKNSISSNEGSSSISGLLIEIK